ncbi:hypothetical protein ACH5RR_001631 [Cinchona calisaya]|uniref:TRF2/HOY1 PH-like domain-containing protein n=1 Tax=Cinchona calisaya TaxID=153742 RepID=A0ABD3B4H9_9GENT
MVEENGHFSSPEQIQNHTASFDVSSNQQVEEEMDASDQPSPLGLTLKKSPSLINLLEEKLFKRKQTNAPNKLDFNGNQKKPTSKMDDFGSQPMSEKLKASNFPAMLLKIGTWEVKSMHEGDLVAKCYFAKRKLVWEVLGGALKSKIEIQWSDIIGIRATIADNQPGILEIELHQSPSFCKENDPQPRKHTNWSASQDFTGGQALICRRHYVRFLPGALDKHYEKLLQCDQRLQLLSQRPFPSQRSPYFDADAYGFSLDFNEFGSQFFPGLHYLSYQSFPSIPIPAQNLRQITRPPLRIIDSNSPVSVNDFVLENQTRALWGEPNLANETHANLDFPGHIINSMNYEEEVGRKSNIDDNALLNHIENHLLSGDENTIMHSSLDGAIDNSMTNNTTLCYSEPMNWLPFDVDEGMIMQQLTNNCGFPTFMMNEELSALVTNPNVQT